MEKEGTGKKSAEQAGTASGSSLISRGKDRDPGKKDCLMILPRPVFPLISGYSNKNWHLIRGLSEQYNLSLIVITEGGPGEKKRGREERKTAEEEAFYKENVRRVAFFPISVRERCAGVLRCLFEGKPLQAGYYRGRAVRDAVAGWAEEADIVIASLVRTASYLEDVPGTKVKVFDMVDSIGGNYIRSAGETSSRLLRRFLLSEGRRLIEYEKEWVGKADVTFFVNGEERESYRDRGETVLLPHGVKEELFTYDKYDPRYSRSVVFLGKMDYRPNVEAVLWYAAHVHPYVGKEHPLIIAGARPAREILRLGEEAENVTVTGYCEDPYVYLNSAMAVIAPMRTGGGIQNKVLEGMALGKVNIVSSLAARAVLGAEAGVHFLVADSPEEYREMIRRVSEEPERYRRMGMEAGKLIRERYTWERYLEGYVGETERIRRKKKYARKDEGSETV